MSTFGKSAGGGRRSARRESLPLPAVVSTIEDSRVVEVVDVSATGARLRGRDLPRAGDAMWLRIEQVRRFACVSWSELGECGVEFDVPLGAHEVVRLRQDVHVATVIAGSMQQMLAMQDWQTGFAR